MAATRVKRSRSRGRGRRRAAETTTPTPGPGERLWVLDVPYSDRALLAGTGARWDATSRCLLWVGAAPPAALARYRSKPYTWPRMVEDALNPDRPAPPDPAGASMRPRPVQVEGARAIARHAAAGGSQFLLADEPGVGKTLAAIIGAKAACQLRRGRRILVIADRPAAITIGHWCRSIAAVGDGGYTWCVTTYDRLEQVTATRWDVIIADEAHMLRHPTTKRWRHFLRLSGFNRKTGHPYLIATTATPAHSPLELSWLAAAFADRHGGQPGMWADDVGAAMQQAGIDVTKGRYGWQWTDNTARQQADMATIRGWLEGLEPPAQLHRPAPQGPAPINPMAVQLSPTEWMQYLAEWGEFCAEMNLARRGRNVARGRAAVLRFRQKAGLIRVAATCQWAQQQVDAGRQVAISVQYVETAADPITDWLEGHGTPTARLYGQGRFDPETERVKFQRGQAPVVVFTPTASLSLHAGEQLGDGTYASTTPRVGIFHQARYSGIQGRQIVGRIHRDNQVAPWWVAFADGTVEEQVAKVMVDRFAITAAAVGGDTAAIHQIAKLLHADWLPADALDSD